MADAARAVVVAALAVAPAGCTRRAPETRVVVTIAGDDPAALARSADAVDAALAAAALPATLASSGLSADSAAGSTRATTRCPRGAVTVLTTAEDAGRALQRVRDAVARLAAEAPGVTPPAIEALGEVVAHIAVRGPDPFVARDAIDLAIAPALRAVAGVVSVDVRGGRREQQVRVDARRLVLADVAVPDLLSAIRSASALDTLVVRTEPLVRLVDLAEVGPAPAGEPLRRDGAVDVVVRGDPVARATAAAVIAAARLPAGVTLVTIDEDSDEGVAVRARAAAGADAARAVADVDELRRALLAIPGVRLGLPAPTQQLFIDESHVRALSLDPTGVGLAARAADGGIVVRGPRGPLRVLIDGAAEAVLSLPVGRLNTGEAVRLFDVARASVGVPERHDRLDGSPAERVVLRFDVGARRAALDDVRGTVEAWAARHGGAATIERAADATVFDSVCP